MTEPTQAQIETASMEIDDYVRQTIKPWVEWRGHRDSIAEIITRHAALTAAAEVEPSVDAVKMAIQITEAATIERCAQVVKELAEKYLVQFPIEYNAIMRAHAAIRAMKDKP